MPTVDCVVSTPLEKTFRSEQISGMFGVELARKAEQAFRVEVPSVDEEWRLGVIVGPSGSGKSSVARHVYGDLMATSCDWPSSQCVLDGFPEDVSIKDVTSMLASVGFSSPPAWLRPYHVLSNGEKFRCDLARAILVGGDLVVFDEFTSVVDRTVAKIGSAAVAKAVRRGTGRFVAVTCHYDVIDWLEPDWVLDMANSQLARGSLWRRPPINLRLRHASPDLWPMFARHHYLNTDRLSGMRCYAAEYEDRPVCFVGVGGSWGNKGVRMIRRVVTLPDYQGAGIAGATLDAVADITSRQEGVRQVRIVTSHPGMIAALKHRDTWRLAEFCRHGRNMNVNKSGGRRVKSSHGRPVASFVFRPRTARVAPGPEPDRPAEDSPAPTPIADPSPGSTRPSDLRQAEGGGSR